MKLGKLLRKAGKVIAVVAPIASIALRIAGKRKAADAIDRVEDVIERRP